MPTHAATMKTAIEAVLENRVTADIEAYTIDGRQITKIPMAELMRLHKYYTGIVNQETAAASVEAGTGNPNKIKVKFL